MTDLHLSIRDAARLVVFENADFENMTDDQAQAMRALRAALRRNGVQLTGQGSGALLRKRGQVEALSPFHPGG